MKQLSHIVLFVIKPTTFILLLLISPGCRKGTRDQSGIPPIDSTKIKTDLQTKEYFVWVDNLRARKSPGMNGDILLELKQGEKLIFLDEKSDFKDKVNLRGKDYEDYWLKMKIPDGRIAWVFGGAVTNDKEFLYSIDEYVIKPGVGVGRIRLGDSYKDVLAAYGEANVERTDVFYGEDYAPGLIIKKNTPDVIECLVSPKTGNVDVIFLRHPSGKWRTSEGIGLGTSLDSLVKMNGKPISFSGFGWDYGGAILSFNNGRLSHLSHGLVIYLAEPSTLEDLDEFIGDHEVSTTDKRILKKGVRIGEIVISRAEPNV